MTKAKDTGSEPSAAELRALAAELIQDQSVMTLATAMNATAWAAPVYYVYREPGFYFLSGPDSRHIQEALASDQLGVAIHVPSFDWREIRGMQMSGRLERVAGKVEAVTAIGAYLKKFPFTKSFFTPGAALDIAAFESRFRVKLYRFIPSLAYYLDNEIRFGFREEVVLNRSE